MISDDSGKQARSEEEGGESQEVNAPREEADERTCLLLVLVPAAAA